MTEVVNLFSSLCISDITLSLLVLKVIFSEERVDFKLPKNLDDAKRLGLLLSKYKDEHYKTVYFGIATVYIL